MILLIVSPAHDSYNVLRDALGVLFPGLVAVLIFPWTLRNQVRSYPKNQYSRSLAMYLLLPEILEPHLLCPSACRELGHWDLAYVSPAVEERSRLWLVLIDQ